MIYNKIYDFCKVKNKGNCFMNGPEPTPRVKFIMDLLDAEGIEYELDVFEGEKRKPYKFEDRPERKREKKPEMIGRPERKPKKGMFDFLTDLGIKKIEDDEPEFVNKYFNIIMRGSSNKMIVAHHDINNPRPDNANDNSCSVINVIATKKLRPEINAVLLDGEEFGGIGSNHLSKQIKAGEFGVIDWVLNFELTGKGGKYFFIGAYPGRLSDKITGRFNCPIVHTPFNDSVILRRHGIDSVVINPIPPLPDGEKSSVQAPDGKYLDISMLYNCHSMKDSLSTISVEDMKEFVEEVVLKIID